MTRRARAFAAPDLPEGLGVPVELISPLQPFVSPQFTPGAPNNLPANKNRPPLRVFESGVSGVLDPTGPNGLSAPPSIGPLVPDASQNIYDGHHYANVIPALFPVPITQDPVAQNFLVRAAGRRNLLVLRNTSTVVNMYINFGALADANSVIRLVPNQILYIDEVVPQDDLYVFGDAAGGFLSFGYSTIAV